MKLRELLAAVDGIECANIPDIDIQGLKTNSHACTAGDLFIGMPGTRVDGGEFWPGALAAGAVAADSCPRQGPFWTCSWGTWG